MTVRQLVGDCRVTLPTLEPGSVQAIVTSPPYYGLRDYGLPSLVWGGDAEHAHEWRTAGITRRGTLNEGFNHRWNPAWTEGGAQVDARPLEVAHGNICFCGAWLGSLGLEPTPDLYVEHLVEVFRHVRRVLRDDGVLWLNLGDSYNNRSVARRSSHQGGLGFESPDLDKSWAELTREGRTRLSLTSNGLKEKDLLMMPFRVAMALQADGWYLRSVIPWLKRNSMPESVVDRPSTAVEYVFLLSKSARYFWDADAVRQSGPEWGVRDRAAGVTRDKSYRPSGQPAHRGLEAVAAGRNRRNSDWFFESWQGLLLNEDDAPLALIVNPAPFTGSHFATFPPKLVEPMIKASTRPGDTVLDSFGGAGTVGLVADRLQRNAILCELSDAYAPMAADRITADAPMFVEIDGNYGQGEPQVVAQKSTTTPRNDGDRWNQNNGRGF